MGVKNSGPRRASNPNQGTLVPGSWNDNPITCRILRNAGFELPGLPKKDDPIRT